MLALKVARDWGEWSSMGVILISLCACSPPKKPREGGTAKAYAASLILKSIANPHKEDKLAKVSRFCS
jgi:hypothetical protein